MSILHSLTSSLEKVFLDTSIADYPVYNACTALKGERVSFQVIWNVEDETIDAKRTAFAKIDSPLAQFVQLYTVESVPVRFPVYKGRTDDNYLRTTAGLYPDLMLPADEKTLLYIPSQDAHALWVDVVLPEDVLPAEYPVTVKLVNGAGAEYFSETFTLTVIDATLPKQTLKYTNWFHCDCLAQYYKVPVWSEEHWQIIENFMRTAAQNGQTMILTPIFTPPLDTQVGGERLTTQLVGVTKTAGEWAFDFTLLGRWIATAHRAGLEQFEISHLFTQWGAGHAPKVIATVDGETKRVFGWDTDSLGEEYKGFLSAFLPKLVNYLKAQGVAQNCVFHVSDEPHVDQLEQYRAARAVIAPYLEGFTIMDALSSYEFYSSGALDHPIPASNHIEPFLENNVPHLWTYYCCGQVVNVSNRLLAMPGARTRMIGVQMYKYNIEGFLQWGYNFYNSQYSIHPINPYLITDGEYFYPAGDGYMVYPAHDGTAYNSIRQRHFAQGLEDMRVLALAESLLGREKVMELIEGDLEEKITFSQYPHGSAYLLALREKVMQAIQ